METPAQIEFQGMDSDQSVRDSIAAHIAKLEDRFGRVTSCRVVIRAPGAHHRTGGLHHVHVQLGLPDGRHVHVGRTPSADERHADLDFAINDAFKRARRQLQDKVRRMRGRVKSHEDPPIATVTRIDTDAGFGFLETADGREIYFHENSVLDGNFSRLSTGTRVAFAEEMGDKGPQASTVRLLGRHGMRP